MLIDIAFFAAYFYTIFVLLTFITFKENFFVFEDYIDFFKYFV